MHLVPFSSVEKTVLKNGPKFLLRPDACFWYNEFSDKRSTNLFEVIQPLSSAGERAALFVHAILQNQ